MEGPWYSQVTHSGTQYFFLSHLQDLLALVTVVPLSLRYNTMTRATDKGDFLPRRLECSPGPFSLVSVWVLQPHVVVHGIEPEVFADDLPGR